MKVCVVVPTYDEKENVGRLVMAVEALLIPDLVLLFVDDSSPDGTGEAIRALSQEKSWVHLLSRESKKGIGSAYVDGFREALDAVGADVVVEMDADLQHPPETLKGLLKAVEEGADVAIASRYVPGGGIAGWGRWRRMVSRGANGIARTLLGLTVRDCTSGFRAYRKGQAKKVVESSLPARGFEFQVATLHLLGRGTKMVEVPYVFSPRSAGRSKLGFLDILRFFISVVKMSV